MTIIIFLAMKCDGSTEEARNEKCKSYCKSVHQATTGYCYESSLWKFCLCEEKKSEKSD